MYAYYARGKILTSRAQILTFVATFIEQFSNFYSSEISRKELKGERVENKHAAFIYQGGF